MTAPEALTTLRSRGYKLVLQPGGILVSGGYGLAPHIRALVKEHRAGLIGLLEAETRHNNLNDDPNGAT